MANFCDGLSSTAINAWSQDSDWEDRGGSKRAANLKLKQWCEEAQQ